MSAAVDAAHLRRIASALHPLSAAPEGQGWNHAELADVLPPTVPLVEAAVLVGLVPREHGPQVLLTRRTDGLRHHGGQVSFPGGRIEAHDRDAAAAAVRETGEEVGIPPEQLQPAGYLDPFVTITGFRVIPVVATVSVAYVARPDPREVADVFEVPLAFLMDPATLGGVDIEHAGRLRRVWEYRYPGQRIWGATAAILLNLRERLRQTG